MSSLERIWFELNQRATHLQLIAPSDVAVDVTEAQRAAMMAIQAELEREHREGDRRLPAGDPEGSPSAASGGPRL
jgi:hypothetical protein